MNLHQLKCAEEYYTLVADGTKNFEIRLGDRDYKMGDTLVIHEVDDYGEYTGRSITRTIAYPFKLSVCAKFYETEQIEGHGLIVLGLEDEQLAAAEASAAKWQATYTKDIDIYEKEVMRQAGFIDGLKARVKELEAVAEAAREIITAPLLDEPSRITARWEELNRALSTLDGKEAG